MPFSVFHRNRQIHNFVGSIEKSFEKEESLSEAWDDQNGERGKADEYAIICGILVFHEVPDRWKPSLIDQLRGPLLSYLSAKIILC